MLFDVSEGEEGACGSSWEGRGDIRGSMGRTERRRKGKPLDPEAKQKEKKMSEPTEEVEKWEVLPGKFVNIDCG